MYIQAVWKQDNGTGQIGQVIEVAQWIDAAYKLPRAFEGYTLYSMNNVPFTVDTVDMTGNCYVCTFTDKITKKLTSVYIFDKTFEGVYQQIRMNYGVEPESISETQLTFKNDLG